VRWAAGRVAPSPVLLGPPIRDSMGLRTWTLPPVLIVEPETDGLEAAEELRGSSLTMGLEGSDAKETAGAPLDLEPVPLGAESSPVPEDSTFCSPLCSPSGHSWNAFSGIKKMIALRLNSL